MEINRKRKDREKQRQRENAFVSKTLPVPALAFDSCRCEAMRSKVPGFPYKPVKYISDYMFDDKK